MRALAVVIGLAIGMAPLGVAAEKNVHHAKVKKNKFNGPKVPKHKAHSKVN
jgi:hypothetical protein